MNYSKRMQNEGGVFSNVKIRMHLTSYVFVTNTWHIGAMSVGSVSASYVSGPLIDTCVGHIFSWISLTSSADSKKSKLSVSGERMCTKYMYTASRRLAKEQSGKVTDRRDMAQLFAVNVKHQTDILIQTVTFSFQFVTCTKELVQILHSVKYTKCESFCSTRGVSIVMTKCLLTRGLLAFLPPLAGFGTDVGLAFCSTEATCNMYRNSPDSLYEKKAKWSSWYTDQTWSIFIRTATQSDLAIVNK